MSLGVPAGCSREAGRDRSRRHRRAPMESVVVSVFENAVGLEIHAPFVQRADVAQSVTENLAALQAAKQRYSEGAIDFLNVIAAQAQLLQSENDLADVDTQIAINLVNLYRALGGGWEVADVVYGSDRAPRQKIGTR